MDGHRIEASVFDKVEFLTEAYRGRGRGVMSLIAERSARVDD